MGKFSSAKQKPRDPASNLAQDQEKFLERKE
jgi:hypothetical protein